MDAVRLTVPTVLNTKADTYAGTAAGTATPPIGLPAGVLLVVAHGGHKIAFQHPPAENATTVHGFDPQVLADLLLTNSALFEQLFDLTVGETRLIGWPLSLQVAVPFFGFRRGPEEGAASGLRALSVVFVLAACPAEGDEAKYDRALKGCQSAVDLLAHALQREEATGGLVSRHVAEGAVTIRDGASGLAAAAAAASMADGDDDGGAGGGAGNGVGGDAEVVAAPAAATVHATVDDLEPLHTSTAGEGSSASGASEVGAVLQAALQALQNERPVTLRVGAHIDVAICVPPPPPPPPRLAAVVGGMPPPPALRPYLALLPLDDVSSISRELPPDASPVLLRLLNAANPLRSLEQLADETGIAMPMITRIARHLHDWGKVRLIHPLTEHSLLCVHPDAPLHEPPHDFRRRFGPNPEPTYEQVLALFSSAQSFASVIRQSELLQLPKRRLIQMTTALLCDGALQSLHTYVHLVAEPPRPPANAPEVDIARYRLYRNLRPMLHGQHHLEEMMWHEKLGRERVHDLLEAYAPYLVSVVTVDESVESRDG